MRLMSEKYIIRLDDMEKGPDFYLSQELRKTLNLVLNKIEKID